MKLLLSAVLALTLLPSAASAQQIKQKKGEWSISICQQNAARNGYGSGASYCAAKADEQRKKGRKVVP